MIDAIITALKALTLPAVDPDPPKQAFMDVQGAVEFAALKDKPPARLPTAYVIPLGDQAEPNRMAAGAHRQKVTDSVAVVLALRSVRDTAGSVDAVTLYRDIVRDALTAFAPGEGYASCDYLGGRLILFQDGIVWWQVAFRSSYLLTKA